MNDDERSPRISLPDLGRAIPALRFVFWGGLVCLIDVRVNGVDLLNDVPGMILVSIGAWRLASIRLDAAYRRGMLFAAVASLAGLGMSILELLPRVEVPRGVVELAGLLEIAALAVFAWMMVRLCRAAELPDVAADWTRTLRWFLAVYAGLLGLLRAAATLWWLAGYPRSWIPSMHPSAWFALLLLLLGVLLVPWIRMFLSTSRLAKALQLKRWVRTRRLRPSSAGRTGGGP